MLYLSNETSDKSKPISSLMREAMFSPEMKLLDELLEEFQNSGHKMTMAIDEFGDISGVLTLSRCIEKIVGDVGEEGQLPKKKIIKVGNDTYMVDGGICTNAATESTTIISNAPDLTK